jgi:uncharacterized protein (DUF2267 family)
MPINFIKNAEKGNVFLKELALELGDVSNTNKAGRIVQSVFKTLRNYLTLEENFQLISQLPMAVKSIYINGWRPFAEKELSRDLLGFIEDVIASEGNAFSDFSSLEDAEFSVNAVFKTMQKYVSEGEFKDIEAILPTKLKSLVKENNFSSH